MNREPRSIGGMVQGVITFSQEFPPDVDLFLVMLQTLWGVAVDFDEVDDRRHDGRGQFAI